MTLSKCWNVVAFLRIFTVFWEFLTVMVLTFVLSQCFIVKFWKFDTFSWKIQKNKGETSTNFVCNTFAQYCTFSTQPRKLLKIEYPLHQQFKTSDLN